MKPALIFFALIFLNISCQTTKHDDKAIDDTDVKNEIVSESSVVYDPSDAIWKYDYNEQTNEFELIQLLAVNRDTLTSEMLENIINTTWPRVKIKFLRTSNDTAFVSIPYAEVLTQQMGSAGAESFMITTTFSLTELQGINYLSFDFVEGDHAIPGVYNRNSWNK